MTEHPTPRFEVVHKPRRATVLDTVEERSFLHDETTLHQTVASELNPQPWLARFIGANGAEVWRTSESYVDVRDAEHAISLLAEAFGITKTQVFEDLHDHIVTGIAPGGAVSVSLPVLRVEVGP